MMENGQIRIDSHGEFMDSKDAGEVGEEVQKQVTKQMVKDAAGVQ